ncbi:MAG TPA: heparin/heparin-sulfate lyase HepB [Clostridia bacterium]
MKSHLTRKGRNFLYVKILLISLSLTLSMLSIGLISGKTAAAETKLIPPGSHPRLFINISEIASVKNNLVKNPEVKKKIISDALMSASPQNVVNGTAFNISSLEDVRKNFEANAFLYLLKIDPATGKDLSAFQDGTGRKSISLALETLSVMDKLTDYEDYDNSQACGRCILGAAFVYDWCYSLLSTDEKNSFIKYCESLASKMEIGYPPNNWGAIDGHSVGSPLMVDLLGFGVASYNEKPDMYNLISNWFLNQVVPARNFWYPSGLQHQGDSYGTTQLENTMLATWIFARMGYDDVIDRSQGQLPYRWIYTRRPDGQLLSNGDSFICDQYRFGEYWKFPMSLMLVTSYYKDPYLVSELSRQYEPNITGEPIFEALFYSPGMQAKSIKDLPLTRYFGYPMGTMVVRTGWDEGLSFGSSNVVAEMKVGVYQFNGHEHLDSGQFQIYYKGALAIDSGIYNGSNGQYGSLHDVNYYKRTIAHNSVLVYDPNEVTTLFGEKVANDGGQRWPNDGTLPQTLDELLNNKDYNVGSVLSYYTGPDKRAPEFSYLQGDLTKAYSSKIKNFKRSFVFMNLKNPAHPAALIVYDKINSSNKDFKKYWLLHSIDPPYIENNVTTIAKDGFIGNTKGAYNGKVVNHTLIPDLSDLNIEKIGGLDNRFPVFNGKEGYINYPNTPHYDNTSIEPGSWRVQISPKTNREFDRFLNVMEIMDYKDQSGANTKALSVKKVDGDLVEGTKIADRVILFNKADSMIKSNINFNIESQTGDPASYKFLVTDLSEGSWSVKIVGDGGSSDIGPIYVSSNGVDGRNNNVLEFDGPAGQYFIYKSTATDTIPTLSPSPTPVQTPTPKPIATQVPTTTLKPTASPVPTVTPKPTASPTPMPTQIPSVAPSPVKVQMPDESIPTVMPTPAVIQTSPTPAATPVATAVTVSTPGGGGGGGGGGGVAVPVKPTVTPDVSTVPAVVVPAATPAIVPDPVPKSAQVSFKDIQDGYWASEPIYTLAQKGILTGRTQEEFKPDEPVTRAEITKMMTLGLNIFNKGKDVGFSDVSGGSWYYEYVASAYSNGIISGRPDNTFSPEESITRQDAAVMLSNFLTKYRSVGLATNDDIKSITFYDSKEIAEYARNPVALAVKHGIIKGKPGNLLDPGGKITRAECAVIIYRLINK